MQPNLAIPTASSQLTDEDVVARVVAGETPLFELLMRRHNQRVYRAVRAILRGASDAEVEDAMQQAYLLAYAHLEQFAGAAKFSTWLIRIAVNESCGRLRRRAPLSVPFDGEIMSDASRGPPTPEDHASSHELLVVLQDSVDQLPETYRVVFMLREVEGMDTDEAAAALDISAAVVKTRLHRAKELLRQTLSAAVGAAPGEMFQFHAVRCDRVVGAVLAKLPGAR